MTGTQAGSGLSSVSVRCLKLLESCSRAARGAGRSAVAPVLAAALCEGKTLPSAHGHRAGRRARRTVLLPSAAPAGPVAPWRPQQGASRGTGCRGEAPTHIPPHTSLHTHPSTARPAAWYSALPSAQTCPQQVISQAAYEGAGNGFLL